MIGILAKNDLFNHRTPEKTSSTGRHSPPAETLGAFSQSRDATLSAASSEVMIGQISKSTMSLQFAIHWSRRVRSAVSITW